MTAVARLPMRMRALRHKRGFTQATLAERAGLSREHVARLEAGRHDPKLSVLERIAKALNVSVVELLT